MAKKDKAADGDEAPKKKKPIVPIVLVVVGLFAGKTFFGGGGGEASPEQMKAELKAAEEALATKCAAWNGGGTVDDDHSSSDDTESGASDHGESSSEEHSDAASDGSTTIELISTRGATVQLAAAAAAEGESEKVKPGPVLEMSATTINLADGRYLKVGFALQMPEGADGKLAKEEGKGARAADIAISMLQAKTMKELLPPTARTEIKHAIGNEVCLAYEGEILTIYFTEFVMQ